jgi:hypothetical protein
MADFCGFLAVGLPWFGFVQTQDASAADLNERF